MKPKLRFKKTSRMISVELGKTLEISLAVFDEVFDEVKP
jgi:hypothetical protein